MTSTYFMISFGSPSFRAEILPLSMQFEIDIDSCRQHEFGIDTMNALLAREFASQLQIQLQCRLSFFQPRDRDVRADPPLEGGLDPDLAGQASVDSMDRNPVNRTGQMHYMQDCILKSNDIQNNAFFARHVHELNAIFSYHFFLIEESGTTRLASSPTLAAPEVKHEIAMSLEHNSEVLDNVITADIRDEIKTYLQHDGQANFTPENLAAKEHFGASGPSCPNLRDRDVRADPSLKEESDPDLA